MTDIREAERQLAFSTWARSRGFGKSLPAGWAWEGYVAGSDAAQAEFAAALKKANDQAEHFEREWYLRGDALDAAQAEVASLRADAEELRFYRAHGFPYVDFEVMFAEPRVGSYAINLPVKWPNPEGEGTVAATILHDFTVKALYIKARQHIESLGPDTAAALDGAGSRG